MCNVRRLFAFGGLAALMVILTSQEAEAQRPGGGFGGNLFLLTNKGVQEELKITDEQKEKIATQGKQLFSKMGEMRGKFKDLPDEERREKMQKAMKEIQESVVKEIALKPEQVKRLKQIERQQNVVFTLTRDEEVAKDLNITDEQKEKLKDIGEGLAKEMAGLRGKSKENFKENAEKMSAMRKVASEKALKVLTAEQQTKWKEMTGEPFTVKFDFGGGIRKSKEPKE